MWINMTSIWSFNHLRFFFLCIIIKVFPINSSQAPSKISCETRRALRNDISHAGTEHFEWIDQPCECAWNVAAWISNYKLLFGQKCALIFKRKPHPSSPPRICFSLFSSVYVILISRSIHARFHPPRSPLFLFNAHIHSINLGSNSFIYLFTRSRHHSLLFFISLQRLSWRLIRNRCRLAAGYLQCVCGRWEQFPGQKRLREERERKRKRYTTPHCTICTHTHASAQILTTDLTACSDSSF